MKINNFLAESPIFALYQAQGHLINHLQNELQKHDVHLIQGLILTALFFEDREVRPKELSKTFQMTPSNLSHLLRDLEKKELVKRSMHESDARGYVFTLTAAGKKKSLSLIKIFDTIQTKLEKKVGVKSFKDFVNKITKVTNAYQEIKLSSQK